MSESLNVNTLVCGNVLKFKTNHTHMVRSCPPIYTIMLQMISSLYSLIGSLSWFRKMYLLKKKKRKKGIGIHKAVGVTTVAFLLNIYAEKIPNRQTRIHRAFRMKRSKREDNRTLSKLIFVLIPTPPNVTNT